MIADPTIAPQTPTNATYDATRVDAVSHAEAAPPAVQDAIPASDSNSLNREESLWRQASDLNRKLYEDNADLDATWVDFVRNRIEQMRTAAEPAAASAIPRHAPATFIGTCARYVQNLLQPGTRVLTFPAVAELNALLAELNPEVLFEVADWDPRLGWPGADESYDAILAYGVLECMNDPPTRLNDSWFGEGLRTFLKESRRTLKPGRVLHTSAANAVGIVGIRKMLLGEKAIIRHDHFREYGHHELWALGQEIGLHVAHLRSVHCYLVDDRIDCTTAYYMLLEGGWPTDGREDTWFVSYQKPAQ